LMKGSFEGPFTILWNSLIQISLDSILISYQDSLPTSARLGSSFIILVVSRDPLELYSNKCYFTQSNASWTISVKYCTTTQYNKLIKDLEWGTTPIRQDLVADSLQALIPWYSPRDKLAF
jgi:hypothetical protein